MFEPMRDDEIDLERKISAEEPKNIQPSWRLVRDLIARVDADRVAIERLKYRIYSGDGGPRTLDQARTAFKQKLDDGSACECCGRFGKRYRRKLNGSMAASLVALVKLSHQALVAQAANWKPGAEPPTAWVHADAVGRALKKAGSKASYPHGEMGKLVHWGLIEARPGEGDSGGRTSGYWRPTKHGVEFVNRTASVYRTVVLLDNVVEGFEGEEVKIDNVMGDRFDYRELMEARP
jgi:hypothetical protein